MLQRGNSRLPPDLILQLLIKRWTVKQKYVGYYVFQLVIYFIGCKSLVCWLLHMFLFFSRVFLVAVGTAWPNHLAVFALPTSVSELVTTAVAEIVSLGDIGTDTACAGCRCVEISVSCVKNTHSCVQAHSFRVPPHGLRLHPIYSCSVPTRYQRVQSSCLQTHSVSTNSRGASML